MNASVLNQFYTLFALPELRRVAKLFGYALAIHGSIERDLDVIAIPWVDGAASAEVLVTALAQCVRGTLTDEGERKPHGRMNWVIKFGEMDLPYVDVSVMPRSK